MGQPIEVINLEYSAADLRRLASREKRGEVVRRLLALAMILEGHTRTEAAEMNGMDRQTLRDWVHRYNAEGLAGLTSRVGLGPAPLLSEAQMAKLLALVVNGPDPEVDKVVRWRCVDLQEQVARRFSVETTGTHHRPLAAPAEADPAAATPVSSEERPGRAGGF